MRNKNLYFLGLVIFITTALCSCDKNELSEISEAQIEVSLEVQEGIQKFIELVNSPTTRNDFNNQDVLRVYIGPLGNCFRGKGSCLPEVVITPEYKWAQTQQGKDLQKLVDNKQVTLTENYNAKTSTTFYIYTSVENSNLDLVVPIVSE